MASSPDLRWGIIGTGGIAAHTLSDLRLVESTEVIAATSRSQATADAFAANTGIPHAFDDVDRMLALPDLDIVYIATPHGLHAADARRAILAGKHVLCEKPLTMTVADAVELRDLAAEHGVFLMEAMWMKFNPTIIRVQQLIASGAIGEPRFVQAGMGFAPPATTERFWRAELGGGALYDMGVYPITFAHLVLGVPESITTVGRIRDDGVDLEEAVTLGYAHGALAQVTTSIEYSIVSHASIGGTLGTIEIDAPFHAATTMTATTGVWPNIVVEETVTPVEGSGYTPMFRAVNEAVREGLAEHPVHPMTATIEVLTTMETVRDQLAAQRDAAGNR